MKPTEWSYENFRKRNPASKGYDYLNLIYQARELPSDFVVWFSRLFRPTFRAQDGVVFLDALFEEQRYKDLQDQGHNRATVQFWMNLLEVTGLFPELDMTAAHELAESLAKSWNHKLCEEGFADSEPARVVSGEEGEVFVVIGAPPAA